MADLVKTSRRGDVLVATVDNPPVNALSPGVPEGLAAALREALADELIRGLVITGSGRTFIAGADIRQLEKLARGERARSADVLAFLRELERSGKPTAAAINGTAFGGGLELAMACHYRVASPGAKLGQPEVKLGIIPGAAGTQRLPRLVGLAKAAEMCAKGDPISASEARSLGLVDAVAEGDVVDAAIALIHGVLERGEAVRRTCDLDEKLFVDEQVQRELETLKASIAKRARGQIAPGRAIAAVEAAASTDFEQGCRVEQELFAECLGSVQARGMMHVFFGERAVGKIPGLPADAPTLAVGRAAVIGAGTMGTGIATAYAAAGIPVLVKDADAAALERSMASIRKNLEGMAKRAHWAPEEASRRADLAKPTASYDDLRDADLIVEAVFENMALKKEVFGELDQFARDGAILATNTSTLDVDEIARATARPEWVVGHHFFSPAHVMRLLEIVRGERTKPEVLATSLALAKRLGKVGVVVGNCVGFVGNRMYGPYQREANFLVEEGAAPSQVDRAMEEFGMAMGPLAVGDLSGLDVGWRVRKEHAHRTPPGWRQPRIADRLCELGRYGQKTGKGWYRYEAGSRERIVDTEVDAIVAEVRRELGLAPRSIADDEIRERLLLALILEGARILEEGFAYRAVDLDVVYTTGYGFPSWRGGPMFHADELGAKHVYDRVCALEKSQGPWWSPPKLLAEMAAKGGRFHG
jgi:3-hydroxyacyl-CoA dehydrogenase